MSGRRGPLIWVLVLLSLIGAIVSFVLTMMTLNPGSWATSLCVPGEKISCDEVLRSSWAHIAFLPTSVIGLLYFAFLAQWYGIIGRPNRAGRGWLLVPLLINAAGLCLSLRLTYA